MRLYEQAHQFLENHVRPGDQVIDATVGNGYDTLFLARLVGPAGCVFGFDIQELALDVARILIDNAKCSDQVTLFQKGHEEMERWIPASAHGKLSACMFNLGYLPHGDKRLITRPQTTLIALQQACKLLKPNGYLSVLCYLGHEGGLEEHHAVLNWIHSNQGSIRGVVHSDSEQTPPKGPVLHILQKFGAN